MKKFLLLFALVAAGIFSGCSDGRKTIMIVSGWQDLNIGDIAHTPGLLKVLEDNIPDADLIVWKQSVSQRADSLIQAHFPDVRFVDGSVGEDWTVDSPEVVEAIGEADILIHGSGPMLLAEDNLRAWKKLTDKPYGIYGVTIGFINPDQVDLLQEASFIYTRETASLDVLAAHGIDRPEIAFVPDASFAVTMHNDARNEVFMDANGLEDREFICVIPRLRRTPYEHFSPEVLAEIRELNDSCKEMDHAKLREVMTRWVRDTHRKVVICPEMTYQVGIMDELLYDPLPEDVKPYIVKHGWWFPDEAVSLYSRACCVVSFECHSPILSIANGTPAFYIRQKEDTIKGQMYYDLGLTDWVFEMDSTDGDMIYERLKDVCEDYAAAQKYRQAGLEQADSLYRQYTGHILEYID